MSKQTEKSNNKKSLVRDQRGLTTVEYIIILILIAVAAIGLWQAFGESVMDRINESTEAVNGMY